MDLRNNELHALTEEEMEEAMRSGILEPVPAHLSCAARRKLAGRKKTKVSLTSGKKLSKWARKRRRELALTAKTTENEGDQK